MPRSRRARREEWRRVVVEPAPEREPRSLPARGRDEGADLFDRQGPGERFGKTVQHVPVAVGLFDRLRKSGNGPAVVVAPPEEGPVDRDLEPGPGGREDQGRDEGRSDRDPSSSRSRIRGKKRLEPFDRGQVDADRDHRQKRIDDAAVDDHVDVEELVFQDGEGQGQRQDGEESAGRLLAEERAPSGRDRQGVEEHERADTDDHAVENPADLVPLFAGGRGPQGPEERAEGHDADGGEEDPEIAEVGLQAEDLDRRKKQADDENGAEEAAEEEGHDPEERPSGKPLAVRERPDEPEQDDRDQRVSEEEQDTRDEVQGSALDAVPLPADHHGRGEGHAQPVAQARPPVPGAQDEDAEADEEAEDARQEEDEGHALFPIVGHEPLGHRQLPAVLGDDELDRVADPVMRGDEFKIGFVVADLEAVDPDDVAGQDVEILVMRQGHARRPRERFPRDGRPAEQAGEAENAHGEDGDPGTKRKVKVRFAASHVDPVPNLAGL